MDCLPRSRVQDESLCINMLTQKWKIKGSLRRCEEEDERRPEQKQKQRLARVPLANDLYLIRASRFRGEPCCSGARLLIVKSQYKFTKVHALLLREGSSHPVQLKPLFQPQGGSGSVCFPHAATLQVLQALCLLMTLQWEYGNKYLP